MRVVLLGILAFGGFATAFYLAAGWWIVARIREDGILDDRFLSLAIRRAFWLFLAGTILLVWCVSLSLSPVPLAVWTALIYLLPLLWAWVMVLGSTWIEMRARGLRSSLWRFHRFNLFAGFMLWGQRIPFLSAAVTALRFILSGADPVLTLLLHLVLALAVGWGARWVLLNRVVAVRPFPDSRLAVEVRATARDSGIRLRGVILVPTERGQSVNALVATSSRIIFVAEGLWKGLGREELRGVLLHETGHIGQPMTNVFRVLGFLGWPAILAAGQVIVVVADGVWRTAAGLGLLMLLGVAGTKLARMVQNDSEKGADRFAEESGTCGALATALRKVYTGDLAPPGRKPYEVDERLVRRRLRALER